MNFECYSRWDELPDSANALFEQAEKDSVFFSRLWFESLSSCGLDDKQALALVCVVAGNEVMAILPLARNAGNTWYALKHNYTPAYSLLLADHDQAQVLACLAEGLCRLALNGLILEPIAPDDGKLNALQGAMESAGFRCDRFFRGYNWIYRVQGQSYKDYMAGRPTRLRNTIARKQRKLDREHGYEIRLLAERMYHRPWWIIMRFILPAGSRTNSASNLWIGLWRVFLQRTGAGLGFSMSRNSLLRHSYGS